MAFLQKPRGLCCGFLSGVWHTLHSAFFLTTDTSDAVEPTDLTPRVVAALLAPHLGPPARSSPAAGSDPLAPGTLSRCLAQGLGLFLHVERSLLGIMCRFCIRRCKIHNLRGDVSVRSQPLDSKK